MSARAFGSCSPITGGTVLGLDLRVAVRYGRTSDSTEIRTSPRATDASGGPTDGPGVRAINTIERVFTARIDGR